MVVQQGADFMDEDVTLMVMLQCLLSQFSSVQSLSRVRLFVPLWTAALQALCPWDSPGKNTGVGCHALLQGIFPTQG